MFLFMCIDPSAPFFVKQMAAENIIFNTFYHRPSKNKKALNRLKKRSKAVPFSILEIKQEPALPYAVSLWLSR